MSISIMTKVFKESKTKGSARLVLLSLADNASDEGYCWPEISTIARRANVTVNTARTVMHCFAKIGLVRIEGRRTKDGSRQTSNGYHIVTEKIGDDFISSELVHEMSSPSVRKQREEYRKKLNPSKKEKLNYDEEEKLNYSEAEKLNYDESNRHLTVIINPGDEYIASQPPKADCGILSQVSNTAINQTQAPISLDIDSSISDIESPLQVTQPVSSTNCNTPPEGPPAPPTPELLEVSGATGLPELFALPRGKAESKTKAAPKSKAPKTEKAAGASNQTWAMAQVIAEVCNIPFEANRGHLLSEAKQVLAAEGVALESIKREFGEQSGWWYRENWKGRKGIRPLPYEIRRSLLESGALKPPAQVLVPVSAADKAPMEKPASTSISINWSQESKRPATPRN